MQLVLIIPCGQVTWYILYWIPSSCLQGNIACSMEGIRKQSRHPQLPCQAISISDCNSTCLSKSSWPRWSDTLHCRLNSLLLAMLMEPKSTRTRVVAIPVHKMTVYISKNLNWKHVVNVNQSFSLNDGIPALHHDVQKGNDTFHSCWHPVVWSFMMVPSFIPGSLDRKLAEVHLYVAQ